MHMVNLTGSYYEMGRAYGKVLKGVGFRLPPRSQRGLRLGLECRDIVQTVFPEILEEIRGTADEAELSYDGLCAFVLAHPMMLNEPPGCTMFAAHKEGQTWMGRNYDMYYTLKDHLESYYTEPAGGYRSLGQSDIFVGREDGVNERGLGVAMSGITAYFAPGINFWVSIRYILDRCRDVEEAVNYLEEARHHCTITVLVAESSGKMAVVETSPTMTRIRWPDAGHIVSTNHFNHPEMVKMKMFEPPDSRPRYDRCVELLSAAEGPDETLIKGILSDHVGLVCSHRDEIGLGTLWSTVTHLNTLRVWRAEGHPCTSPYAEDTRLRKGQLHGPVP